MCQSQSIEKMIKTFIRRKVFVILSQFIEHVVLYISYLYRNLYFYVIFICMSNLGFGGIACLTMHVLHERIIMGLNFF